MGIKLELLTDPDMLVMFERGIRGGITRANHQYAKANNKHMGAKFNPKRKQLSTVFGCKQSLWLGDESTASNWRI